LQPLTLFFNIYAHRLCAGGHKTIIIIIIIIIIGVDSAPGLL